MITLQENITLPNMKIRFLSAVYLVFVIGHAQNTLIEQASFWRSADVGQSIGSAPLQNGNGQNSFGTSIKAGQYPFLSETVIETQLQTGFKESQSSTLFLVVTPSYQSAPDSCYLKLGDIQVFGDYVKTPFGETPLVFNQNKPTIIAVRSQKVKGFAGERIQESYFLKPDLFELSEIIYFDFLLSRDQVREIETYLAIKYSVNITKNTDQKYRDYFDGDSAFFWSSAVDGGYSKYVIGVGRSDDRDFYQTQTFTNSPTPIGSQVNKVQEVFSLGLDSLPGKG